MSQLSFYKTFLQAKLRDRPGSARQIQKTQQASLRRLLATARWTVPFQSRRLEGISDSNFCGIKPTNKQAMLAEFADTVDQEAIRRFQISREQLTRLAEEPKSCDSWINGRVLLSTTSGTSGATGIVLNSRKSWAIQRAAVFSRTIRKTVPITRFNPVRPYRIAYLVTKNSWSISYQAAIDSSQSNSMLAELRCFSVQASLDQWIEELAAFAPDFLHSYPNVLEFISKTKLSGRDFGFHPEVISSGGDLFSASQREQIAEAFPQSNIVNHYGATECTPIANSCQHGNLHLNSDFVIFEPVDRDHLPVPRGEFSHHVLITNLINCFQPVIRYRLDDTARLIDEPCACGSPFPVLEIKGRSYPLLHVTDNEGRPAAIDATLALSAMFNHPDISRFQFRYHQLNRIEVDIELDPRARTESDSMRKTREAKFIEDLGKLTANINADQSVSFNLNFVTESEFQADGIKRKIFDVSVEAPPRQTLPL